MTWNPEQLRWLRALGHEPMRLAPAGARRVAEGQAAGEAAPVPATTTALAAALARAAGGRDLAALALDLERLRLDPALKRALWPRLRALRKAH